MEFFVLNLIGKNILKNSQEWYIVINFNRKHNLTMRTIYTSFCFIFIG